jgi:hypothetical protein
MQKNISLLAFLVLFVSCTLAHEQKETLSLNKPSLNRIYTYTGPSTYTFTYTDINFGKKDSSTTVEYFVINFDQFMDPIVDEKAGNLKINAYVGEEKSVGYFYSQLIMNKRGNSKMSEKWMNFNENFFVVPLLGFQRYEIQMTVDPTKFKDLDFNQLQK